MKYSQRSRRWQLPAPWYNVTHYVEGQPLLDLYVLDHYHQTAGKYDLFTVQIPWLAKQLVSEYAGGPRQCNAPIMANPNCDCISAHASRHKFTRVCVYVCVCVCVFVFVLWRAALGALRSWIGIVQSLLLNVPLVAVTLQKG